MDRRDLIAIGGALGALTSARAAFAQAEHAGHDANAAHAGHGAKYGELVEKTGHCVMTGGHCLGHCLDTFVAGDTTLAVCAKSVRDLIASCVALQDMAAANSTYVPAMAKVVEMICVGCEKECRKHEAQHVVCKACADACKECAAACRSVAA